METLGARWVFRWMPSRTCTTAPAVHRSWLQQHSQVILQWLARSRAHPGSCFPTAPPSGTDTQEARRKAWSTVAKDSGQPSALLSCLPSLLQAAQEGTAQERSESSCRALTLWQLFLGF